MRIDKYMAEWFADYCLVHRINGPFEGLRPFLAKILPHATMKEFYLGAMGDYTPRGIDTALAAIERQIRKNKTRLGKRLRDDAFQRSLGDVPVSHHDHEDEDEDPVFSIRDKTFPLKPMSAEEAILQMNLLSHDFFVYRDDESGEVHVVYKRHDGKYGRILPTLD